MMRFKSPRMFGAWLLGVLLLAAFIVTSDPEIQIPRLFGKYSGIFMFAALGYGICCMVAPYARPHTYLKRNWRLVKGSTENGADYEVVDGYHAVFIAALILRGMIVVGTMIAGALVIG